MRRLTICTMTYMRELTDFYVRDEQERIIEKHETDGALFIIVPESHFNAPLMMELMQDIILDSNPVVSGSTLLFYRLKRLLFGLDDGRQTEALRQYARLAGYLNVEGYVRFRLSHYENMLSSILYAVVKRNLCIEQ